MIRRPPTRIELRPEDKEEVSMRREPSSREPSAPARTLIARTLISPEYSKK
jgi:hypothetical protein|tara:strand:+ start:227 stop:379 length:153 start_codon:yes stop_codon:yes gene_type:complete